ncbi:MAG: glycosyltransferase [Candidatus Marinimicrobia bacterium]|nr:glycosyltransferase [Candidatus Neomarinimicrobiota bacterium]
MKILIVCSGNSGKISSFVEEQEKSLSAIGYNTEYYVILGKGILGYIKNFKPLISKIKQFRPDIIHAHYGFAGLLACLQRKIPVVITYHGSDINIKNNRLVSTISSRLARVNIFVHKNLAKKIYWKKNNIVIPCGVDLTIFREMDRNTARIIMGLRENAYYALFSASFSNLNKNSKLAIESITHSGMKIALIPLENFTRHQVNLLLNAVDFLLVTSISETGPLVVKEAMCANCRCVSTDVGDVRCITNGVKGYYIAEDDNPETIGKLIVATIEDTENNRMIDGRTRITELNLDLDSIARLISIIYCEYV